MAFHWLLAASQKTQESAKKALAFIRRHRGNIGAMYGSEHIVYGSNTCPGCGLKHGPDYQVKETSLSRFRLLQFAAEMTAFDMKGHNRRFIASAFEKARSGGDLSKLNKKIREKERDIEKGKAVELNTAQLGPLRAQYSLVDKQVTAPLRDIEKSFEKRFPGTEQGYSPSYAASQRGEDVKFMLGILISGGDVLISASGNGISTQPFRGAAALKGYEICPEVDPADPHKSVVDRTISTVDYSNTRTGQGYAPGNCAAPRLLARAFAIPKIRANYKNWEMSEMYYFPNNDARRAHEAESDKARQAHVAQFHKDATGNPDCQECRRLDAVPVGSLYWVPGLTAHSCETCEQLVPLLMCPKLA